MKLVLIVEDNAKNLKLVRDILQARGYETLEARSAEDGLRIARDRRPQLVLMDIQLPGMNGIEALRHLRSDPATHAIPVIAISASVMQPARREIMEAGFDGFIEKPIGLREFRATVERVLPRG
jgi:two-component system cell cycle response regulator DivK